MADADAVMQDAWAAYERARPNAAASREALPPAFDFLATQAPLVLRALQHLAAHPPPPLPASTAPARVRAPHHCTRRCPLVEGPAPHASHVYVCRLSGHVHLCTAELCRYTYEVYSHGGCADSLLPEHLVCELTQTAYPPPLAVEHLVERASYVPDYATRGTRRARALDEAHRLTHARQEAEPRRAADPAAGSDAATPPPPARVRPPAAVAALSEAQRRHREEHYWDTVGRLLPELAPGQPLWDWLARTFAQLWALLARSAAFAANACNMGADMFALAVCYHCARGLSLPARATPSQVFVLLDPQPDVAARLPTLRLNPHFAVHRLTSAQKAMQRCLCGLDDRALDEYTRARPRREQFCYAPPQGRALGR